MSEMYIYLRQQITNMHGYGVCLYTKLESLKSDVFSTVYAALHKTKVRTPIHYIS